ncbi:DUF4145 domain-containing protein [Teredinibacter haidensis]|uniref:DUF4145 domain-containing protein n=1 Tax=Teredinibacter haidensis TaxID=2731755 RepID=UPI000948AF9E|nr:DUF4145 domain-containing protein [Teredinibacter haidensis]
MFIQYVDVVKEVIGSQSIEVLREMFERRKGEPPSIPVQRFRADHAEWLNTLDELENKYSLIERTRECNEYLIRPYALPLIDTQESRELLSLMDQIYKLFPELYRKHLTQPLSIDVLSSTVLGNKQHLINESLYYLSESHGVYSGMTTGFPYTLNGTLCISESVLTKQTISEILSEYYAWHFVNPKSQVMSLESFDLDVEQSNSLFFKSNTSTGKPGWYDLLGDTQKALILEIDIAMTNKLDALPTIGLRTLLETVMVEKIGDARSFGEKVKCFTKEGYVTPKMADALRHVLDAGNASAHRAYFPSKEDLTTCVELVKHLMHGIYILSPKVAKVAENTPKRDRT